MFYLSKKNISLIIIVSLFIFLIIRTFIGFAERSNSLNGENVKITVGTITDFRHGGKVSPWFYYEYKFKNKPIITQQSIEGNLRAAKNDEIRKYIGKRYFVKFSVENPKYSELFFDKPVPDDFVYNEGQTWKTIPISYD
mgnify:CR=1 FL=1